MEKSLNFSPYWLKYSRSLAVRPLSISTNANLAHPWSQKVAKASPSGEEEEMEIKPIQGDRI